MSYKNCGQAAPAAAAEADPLPGPPPPAPAAASKPGLAKPSQRSDAKPQPQRGAVARPGDVAAEAHEQQRAARYSGKPEFVALPAICRAPDGDDALLAPRMIPTATHLRSDSDFWTRLGAAPTRTI